MTEDRRQRDLLQITEGKNGNMELDSYKIILHKFRHFKAQRNVEKLVTSSKQTLAGMPNEITQSRENNVSGIA